MGATINSTATPGFTLDVFRIPGGEVLLDIRSGERASIYVRETELKAALGIDELGCGCDDADENLAAAIARAERAEAKVARVEHLIHNATSGSKPAGLTLANGTRFGLVSTVDLRAAIFDADVLDSEAQRLYSASHVTSIGHKGYHDLSEEGKDIWRAVARKAREVHGAQS